MFPKGMSVLALAAYFHNTGALKAIRWGLVGLRGFDRLRGSLGPFGVWGCRL